MKVLLITNEFPSPCEPNKATFNLAMARALARAHEVRVVSPVPWTTQRLTRKQQKDRLKDHRCRTVHGIEVHYPRYIFPPRILRSHYGWFYWASIRATLRRLERTFQPDVVLSYWAHPDGEAGTRAARRLGVPSIVMTGGSDVLVLTGDAKRRQCVTRSLHAADAVVTVSEHLKNAIIKLGLDASKLHVWRRGVDPCFTPGDRAQSRSVLGIGAGPPVLLWVGRMVGVKGLHVLMKVCGNLRDKGVVFNAYLIGDGPLFENVKADRDARQLDRIVHLVGTCQQEHLADWYRAADLTVLTSHSEGMPNVLLESLACGTPFVASNVGGIPELAAGRPDWLVKAGDADAFADAIARAFTPGVAPGSLPHTTRWAESTEALTRILAQTMRPTASDSASRYSEKGPDTLVVRAE